MDQTQENELGEAGPDIKEYLYLFRSWAWVIVLAGLLAGIAAYIVSSRITPVYETSTRLLISAPSTSNAIDPTFVINNQTVTTIMSTYAQMLLDRPVLQGVIDQLKLPTTPQELAKSVSVDVVLNTQLLTITARDPDPRRAADIANAMATVFAARTKALQSDRYAASRDALAKQMIDMEQQIATTSSQITAIEQPAAAAATQTAQAANAGTPVAPAGTSDSAMLVQLQARLTQYRTVYASLVTSYEQVRLAEEQTNTNVIVSEPAAIPLEPVTPKTGLNTALAVVLGMLLTAGGVFTALALDDTIQNPAVIHKDFGVPVLGVIAKYKPQGDRPVAMAEPLSSTSEAFRSLRTNITHAAVDRPLRRILITSATPQDGKTTVASNLAIVLSQNEKQVVLLDANLRRPQVHRQFGLENRLGLTEMFTSPSDHFGSMINPINPPQLSVLTSGAMPPNPAELLSSRLMCKILDMLNQDFELIVIDAPPLLNVTDAAALAPAVDGVILVARPGITKLAALKQAMEQLRAVGAPILGVVLNEVNLSSRTYGYHYRSYYAGYPGDGQGDRPKQAKAVQGREPRADKDPVGPEAPAIESDATAAPTDRNKGRRTPEK